jgi:protein-tyrosine phosphatase
MRIFGDDKDGKVCKMMSFAGMNRDVSDPWYSGDFEQAYNDIYSGCKGLFEKFKGKA